MNLMLVEEIIYQFYILLNSYVQGLAWSNRRANAIQKKYLKKMFKNAF